MNSIKVDTQFDNKYTVIATRQCSWFCFDAMNNSKILLNAFLENNISKYRGIYDRCLMTASINKHNSKNRGDIETLFHKNIISKYCAKCKFFKMEYNIEGEDYYAKLQYSNTLEVIETKKMFPNISEEELISKLQGLQKYDYMMVNRLIMSFIVIKIENDRFLLIDPHSDESSIISVIDILQYIKYSNSQMYNLVTIAFKE